MLSRTRRRLTFANVCSALALFVALSTGGAYAADTVFSTDIKDGEVKNQDLAFDAVSSSKIRDNSIQSSDINDFTITANDYNVNTIGSSKILNDSLTGDDVLETSLNAYQLGLVQNSDKVDGYDASSIARVGVGSNAPFSSFATFSDLTSVSVTAPRDGFVLVNASAYGATEDPDCVPCYLHMVIRDDTTATDSALMLQSLRAGDRAALSNTWVFPVSAGQRTFTLRGAAARGFNAADVSFSNSVITALFTPFAASPPQASRGSSRSGDGERRRDGTVRRR
jgi:hypothetical protein